MHYIWIVHVSFKKSSIIECSFYCKCQNVLDQLIISIISDGFSTLFSNNLATADTSDKNGYLLAVIRSFKFHKICNRVVEMSDVVNVD